MDGKFRVVRVRKAVFYSFSGSAMVRWFVVLVTAWAGLVSLARAETVILKDGTFVEGKIVLETSRSIRIDSRFGTRTFLKKDIDQIIETIDPADAQTDRFDQLPEALKAVLNARAEYKLKQYDRALSRIEPFFDYSQDKAIRIQIDWLRIELNERLGRWELVKKLLTEKLEQGTPREMTRAQAHLDILNANPNFDLRYVGERHMRNFLRTDHLRERAREDASLRDAEVMEAALEEYCEQLLDKDELSVKAFSDVLDFQTTFDALSEVSGRGGLENHLPYLEELKKAEASLYKAQSILGDYGAAFELDLIRTELEHLLVVGYRMLIELIEASPEQFDPPVDPTTGRLTPDGRREWRRLSDEFIEKARPLQRLLEYMRDKAERYPRDLKQLQDIVIDFQERIDQWVKAVKRGRSRL